MHKVAFLAVALFMLIGMNFTFNSRSTLGESETRLAEDQFEILARNAAIAGLDRTKQLLSEDFRDYQGVQGTNDGVAYTATAVTNGPEVTVHSTGTTTGSDGETITFNVQAKFRQRTTLPPEAPPFMRYAVMSEEDLVLRGNIDGDVFEVDVQGDLDNQLNANMHTNSNLQVIGNAVSVKGFGTYCLTASPNPHDLANNFVPNYNPSGANHVSQLDEDVYIPTLNPATVASSISAAEGSVRIDSTSPGDITLSGNYTLGTRNRPYIWHVQGDVLIANGGTTIDGYVMFLIDGSIDLRGNVRVGNSGYNDGDESSIAIYTGTGTILRGNTEVWAQIYSNGGVEFDRGTPVVYGSVTTKGAVDFRGSVDIFYRKASPALTKPFQPDIFLLDRIAYSEW